MKVALTVTRTFEMDEVRVLTTPGFEPPAPQAPIAEVRKWLQESFFELCGFGRDVDHVDGSYVRLVSEDSETEWYWPRHLDNFELAGETAPAGDADSDPGSRP